MFLYKIVHFCVILEKYFPMKTTLLLLFVSFLSQPLLGQEGFLFDGKSKKATIPFSLINNLVFIPIQVNGIQLNFLLDSGVEETILFGLEDQQEVPYFNPEKINLRGLGSAEPIEGIKSTENSLETKGLKSTKHTLYVVLDQEFNLSSHIGIPVNGIIGYTFLKNNLVAINYQKKKIFVYPNNEKNRKKLKKKYQILPLTIERNKPYISSSITLENKNREAKLLVDIGNSDAVWLFENQAKDITIPAKNFDDYLGQGFSGDVYGKRAKIAQMKLGNFVFNNPIAAFPDTLSIKNVSLVPNRVGSVGGEILKRFDLVFDYPNQHIYLKSNSDFNTPFLYNKSGIEIAQVGFQWVKETVTLQTVPTESNWKKNEGEKPTNTFKYKFQLKPIYEIISVRPNSNAALSGLKNGDVIIRLNGNKAYQFTLQDINSILKSPEQKKITIQVERNQQLLHFQFQLLDEL